MIAGLSKHEVIERGLEAVRGSARVGEVGGGLNWEEGMDVAQRVKLGVKLHILAKLCEEDVRQAEEGKDWGRIQHARRKVEVLRDASRELLA
jgi:hypothetical protein